LNKILSISAAARRRCCCGKPVGEAGVPIPNFAIGFTARFAGETAAPLTHAHRRPAARLNHRNG